MEAKNINTIPCKTCIVFAICNARICKISKKRLAPHHKLFDECEIFRSYYMSAPLYILRRELLDLFPKEYLKRDYPTSIY